MTGRRHKDRALSERKAMAKLFEAGRTDLMAAVVAGEMTASTAWRQMREQENTERQRNDR